MSNPISKKAFTEGKKKLLEKRFIDAPFFVAKLRAAFFTKKKHKSVIEYKLEGTRLWKDFFFFWHIRDLFEIIEGEIENHFYFVLNIKNRTDGIFSVDAVCYIVDVCCASINAVTHMNMWERITER